MDLKIGFKFDHVALEKYKLFTPKANESTTVQ